jgi:hypothetical protein
MMVLIERVQIIQYRGKGDAFFPSTTTIEADDTSTSPCTSIQHRRATIFENIQHSSRSSPKDARKEIFGSDPEMEKKNKTERNISKSYSDTASKSSPGPLGQAPVVWDL